MTYALESYDRDRDRWQSAGAPVPDLPLAIERMLAAAADGRDYRLVAIGAGQGGADRVVAGASYHTRREP